MKEEKKENIHPEDTTLCLILRKKIKNYLQN